MSQDTETRDDSTTGTESKPAEPADKAPALEKAKASAPEPTLERKVGGADFAILDGPPADPPRKREPAPGGKKAKAKGKKGTDAPNRVGADTEEEDGDPEAAKKKMNVARSYVKAFEMFWLTRTLKSFEPALSPEEKKSLAMRLRFTDEEVDMVAEPLTNGIGPGGLEMPWYVQCGIAALMVMEPRKDLVEALKAEREQALLKGEPLGQALAKREAA